MAAKRPRLDVDDSSGSIVDLTLYYSEQSDNPPERGKQHGLEI
jgi:hypothetical protein